MEEACQLIKRYIELNLVTETQFSVYNESIHFYYSHVRTYTCVRTRAHTQTLTS